MQEKLKLLGEIRIKIIDEIIGSKIECKHDYDLVYPLVTKYREEVVAILKEGGFCEFEIDEFVRIGDKLPMHISTPEAQIKCMGKILCRAIQAIRAKYENICQERERKIL